MLVRCRNSKCQWDHARPDHLVAGLWARCPKCNWESYYPNPGERYTKHWLRPPRGVFGNCSNCDHLHNTKNLPHCDHPHVHGDQEIRAVNVILHHPGVPEWCPLRPLDYGKEKSAPKKEKPKILKGRPNAPWAVTPEIQIIEIDPNEYPSLSELSASMVADNVLDNMGQVCGLSRGLGEPDEAFKARISFWLAQKKIIERGSCRNCQSYRFKSFPTGSTQRYCDACQQQFLQQEQDKQDAGLPGTPPPDWCPLLRTRET